MASVKETHFFDGESYNWSSPHYGDLDAFFSSADDRIRGESTPITLYWQPAIQRLRHYNPDVRLLIMLRDPVLRAFSNWRKEYSIQRETLDFATAIRGGRQRLGGFSETEDAHRYFAYVERGFYWRQISHALEHFPRASIHCEIFEDFVADGAPVLRRMSDFLGIRSISGRHAGYPAERWPTGRISFASFPRGHRLPRRPL